MYVHNTVNKVQYAIRLIKLLQCIILISHAWWSYIKIIGCFSPLTPSKVEVKKERAIGPGTRQMTSIVVLSSCSRVCELPGSLTAIWEYLQIKYLLIANAFLFLAQ